MNLVAVLSGKYLYQAHTGSVFCLPKPKPFWHQDICPETTPLCRFRLPVKTAGILDPK